MKSWDDVNFREVIGPRDPTFVNPTGHDGIMTKHGWLSNQEIGQAHGKWVTNQHGERALVFPMHWENGEPVYPPLGPENLERRQAMTADYNERRKKKREGKVQALPRKADPWSE